MMMNVCSFDNRVRGGMSCVCVSLLCTVALHTSVKGVCTGEEDRQREVCTVFVSMSDVDIPLCLCVCLFRFINPAVFFLHFVIVKLCPTSCLIRYIKL